MSATAKHAKGHSFVRRAVVGGAQLLVVGGVAAVLYPPVRQRLWASVHSVVERALSKAVGGTVRFESFTCSPLAGRFEARGVVVRQSVTAEPFLTLSAVRGSIRLSALVTGDLYVDHVELDGPAVCVVHRRSASVGGATTNLPGVLEQKPTDLIRRSEPDGRVGHSGRPVPPACLGCGSTWGEAHLVDGRATYRDETLGAYEIAVTGVNGRLTRSALDNYGVRRGPSPTSAVATTRPTWAGRPSTGSCWACPPSGNLADLLGSNLWAEFHATGPERVEGADRLPVAGLPLGPGPRQRRRRPGPTLAADPGVGAGPATAPRRRHHGPADVRRHRRLRPRARPPHPRAVTDRARRGDRAGRRRRSAPVDRTRHARWELRDSSRL